MNSVTGYGSQYATAPANNGKKMYKTEDGHEYWLSTEDNSSMDISDFFSLIAAQLSNQDFMNPTDNTEFLAQLAQFTAMQMQENVLYAANASFASSLVGKTVIAAKIDSTGNLINTTGVVDRIVFTDDGYEFYIGKTSFKMENLMEIVTPKAPEPSEGNEGDDPKQPPEAGDADPTEGDTNP